MINFYFKTCGVSRKWMIENVTLKLKRVVHWCGLWMKFFILLKINDKYFLRKINYRLMNKNNRFIPNYIDLIKTYNF